MPRASHTKRKPQEIKDRIVRVVGEWYDMDFAAGRQDPETHDTGSRELFDAAMEDADQRLSLLRDLVFDLRDAEKQGLAPAPTNPATAMPREHTLETLQDRYATFRRRAAPGLTRDDLCASIDRANRALETDPHADRGALLGELLIDLCCLAQIEHRDLAFHGKRAFKRMQDEYGARQ